MESKTKMESNGKIEAKGLSKSNVESGQPAASTNAFSNAKIRNNFIQKVYGILAAQFIFTFVITATFLYVQPIKKFLINNSTLLYVSYGVLLFLMVTIAFCKGPRRTVPWNYILLFVFTLAFAIVVSYSCVHYSVKAIFLAVAITFFSCLTVSLLSCWTKFDFTKFYWIAFVVVIVFMLAGIGLLFYKNNKIHMLYAALGVGIFLFCLAIHTQMLIGGYHYQIGPEEYIHAALILYTDIINIFLFILRLFQ